jgi:hypothetical protein
MAAFVRYSPTVVDRQMVDDGGDDGKTKSGLNI